MDITDSERMDRIDEKLEQIKLEHLKIVGLVEGRQWQDERIREMDAEIKRLLAENAKLSAEKDELTSRISVLKLALEDGE